MMRRKICIVTTSRADYGILYWLMDEINRDSALKLQIIVSGMHLSPEFGMTSKIVEKDGWRIDKKIDMVVSSDSETAAIKSLGMAMFGFADALAELHPDMLVLLGDRFELLAPAIASMILKIPIVHLYGGETTQGAVDEAVRHAITKMAVIHFPAAEEYGKRIIQMGESPKNVFNYGSVGLDNLFKLKLLSKSELEKVLELDLNNKTAMVTFHPETLETGDQTIHVRNLLKAIEMAEIQAVFTMANADPFGKQINERIVAFCRMNPRRFKFIDNLGQTTYLSCLKHFDLMIGNSSSGIAEAPSFALPVVNIGDRQKGRIKARNIIDSGTDAKSIGRSIEIALSKDFRNSLKGMNNPYQKYRDGKTALRIKEKLKIINLEKMSLKKAFVDLG